MKQEDWDIESEYISEDDYFRKICDTIWYDDMQYWSEDNWYYYDSWAKSDISEKDMIFTTEFMNKFFTYYKNSNHYVYTWELWFKLEVFRHLDDITNYLYSLIK